MQNRREFLIRQAALCALPAWAFMGIETDAQDRPPLKKPLQPTLILHHGKIVTVDDRFRVAEAMAVGGDRILAVGADGDILPLAAADTQIIDLQGKTVLPGLIDSHSHPAMASVYEFDHEVPEMETIADVLRYVESRAKVLEPGQWIRIDQVFITRLQDRRYPTREELDRAAPRHPVVFRTGPDAALNSLALKRCGIDRNFKVPQGTAGRVELDSANGEPTGILRNLNDLISTVYQPSEKTPNFEQRVECLKKLLADYNRAGITGVSDRKATDETIAAYRALKDRGELTCRVFLSYWVDAQRPLEEVEATILAAKRSPLHRYDNMLWQGGVKIFLDGGMLTGSSYMAEPWGVSKLYAISDPNYRGLLFIEPEKLYRIAKTALKNGLHLTAHCVGDGAFENLTAAYERVDKEFPVRPMRPCVSHANFETPKAIETMRRIGAVADLQPAWLYHDGSMLLDHFGYERLACFQPYKTLFDQGVLVGGGSDHMQKIGRRRSINSYDPFLGMWATMVRKPRRSEKPLHPEQAIDRRRAIQLYTIHCAFLTFEEKEKGSLEKGKLADFIVIDRDILACPVDEVKDIRVLQTFLGGKQVYSAATERGTGEWTVGGE
jgi:predicted amidohydrolase YtcJ